MFALLKAYMKKTTFKVLMWIYRAKSCTGLNELKKFKEQEMLPCIN